MALYRTYRPSAFDQVVGQDVAVQALQSALDSGRLAHAILLSGPHGIGKTTLARLIAQGLLCDKGPTGEPCGDCEACQSCLEGSHPDLLEIDAASNRGVDDARALRERLQMSPMRGKCHVIIIDEAHMLTREAQNALLKALEEPPADVHFIFATTAANKVLPTIRSRCQHYGLHRPSGEELTTALKRAAEGEEMKIDDSAIAAICGIAAGSFRDALTLLDQIYSSSAGSSITSEMVYQLSGMPGPEAWAAVAEHVADGQADQVLSLLQEMQSQGYDLKESMADLAGFLRLVLYSQQTGSIPSELAANPTASEKALELSKKISEEKLWRMVQAVENAYSHSGSGGSATWALEMGLVAAARGWQLDAGNSVAAPVPQAQTSPGAHAETDKLLSTPANKERLEESIKQAAPKQAAASPNPESKPEASLSDDEAMKLALEAQAAARQEQKEEKKAEKKTELKAKNAPAEEIKLPGPAVAAAAFPLLRLALREEHTEVYLALRTAWARYEEGRMLVQLSDGLDKETEKAATKLLRRMVDGSVKITARAKAPAPKPKKKMVANNTEAGTSDPADLMAQFGLTPLDGDKRLPVEEKGDFGLPAPEED